MRLNPLTICCLIPLCMACGSGGTAAVVPAVVTPGCGDGVAAADEECDNGEGNSDDKAGACRTDCRLPRCGDGVADKSEDCDDGNVWGGDGCDEGCNVEDGPLEVEPNDRWDAAQPWPEPLVHGALPVDDVDCFSVDAPQCSAIEAEILGDCPHNITMALHGPDGVMVASGAPTADSCSKLDPHNAPGARFVAEGTWSVCVEGLLGATIPSYQLAISVDLDNAGFDVPSGEDPDGDGLPTLCDPDSDGDGVLNADDNCPDVPNGPIAAVPDTSNDGFIRHWLTIGPFTGQNSPDGCLPTSTNLINGDDANATPSVGDSANGLDWIVHISGGDRIDFNPVYAYEDAPREVYGVVYVYSQTQRDLTFAQGPDDGARAWLNGAVIQNVNSCQGTNIDEFQEPVTLVGGWNRLMIKVHDQGGGWGTYVRFLDINGASVTDLELSLDPNGPWNSDQADLDADGIGDVCDDTPAG